MDESKVGTRHVCPTTTIYLLVNKDTQYGAVVHTSDDKGGEQKNVIFSDNPKIRQYVYEGRFASDKYDMRKFTAGEGQTLIQKAKNDGLVPLFATIRGDQLWIGEITRAYGMNVEEV